LGAHHRFLVQSQLRQLDFFDQQVRELDQEIAQRLGVPNGPDDAEHPDPSGDPTATEEARGAPVRSRGFREHAADFRAAASSQAPQ
jgi:hypothetical protein